VTPPTILSRELASARARGELFEDAWTVALEAALDGKFRSSWERHEWRTVFVETVDEWNRAFDQQPASRPGLALHRLQDPDAVPAPERDALKNPQVQVETMAHTTVA